MQRADSTALDLDYGQYSRVQKENLLALFQEKERRINSRQILSLYPDTGPLRRELYVPHVKFFETGARYRERCCMAANRVGKSFGVGGYELTLHLTGQYPKWWKGKRFDRPIRSWACGTTGQTVRDILQRKLLGPINDLGTGLIPGDCIAETRKKAGSVPDTIETVYVKHVSGGISTMGLKSYEQGRKAFEGDEQDCIAEGELVQMADGRLKSIEEIRVGDEVLTLTGLGHPVKRKVTAVRCAGTRPCIRVETKQGTVMHMTPDHKIFYGYRFKYKKSVSETKKIAQIFPGYFWPEKIEDKDDAYYIWAGLVLSDGCISQRKVTSGKEDLLQKAIDSLPDSARVRRKNFNNNHVPDWFLYWDDFWDIIGNGLAYEKIIPDFIFTSSREKVALFLRWLFGGDGWAGEKGIGYCTTSYQMAQQVHVLLSRMEIRSSFFVRISKNKNWKEQYWITIGRSNEIVDFIKKIGIESREQGCLRAKNKAEERIANKLKRAKRLLKSDKKNCFCEELNRRARLRASKIRKITDAGMKQVYDITVEKEHRFLVGTNLVSNCILLDEEPPVDIYTECLTRTMTTQGIVMLLFTPLQGLSDTVLLFMPGGQIPSEMGKRFVIQATWDDAPHLSQQDKDDIISSYSPHERDARSKGIPQLGSGRVYPISEDDLLVDDFEIPEHWIQAYGFDVGWKATAAVWGALNRESDVLYFYSCYKKGEEKPVVHAAAIKARGEWIPGLSDPAALGRGQRDGKQLMVEYNDLGLKLVPAENPVEAGILKLYKRMTTGRLKVFKSMVQWLEEFRIYRRDDKGKIVKDFDHLMDTTRYLNNSIVSVGIVRPEGREVHVPGSGSSLTSGWAR